MKSKRMPNLLSKVAFCTKKALFCVFEETDTNNCPKIGPSNNNKEQVKDVSPESAIKKPDLPKSIDTKPFGDPRKQPEHDCKSPEDEKHLKIKRQKEEFDSNLTALNYLAFFNLFIFILTCNSCIWISIGN